MGPPRPPRDKYDRGSCGKSCRLWVRESPESRAALLSGAGKASWRRKEVAVVRCTEITTEMQRSAPLDLLFHPHREEQADTALGDSIISSE